MNRELLPQIMLFLCVCLCLFGQFLSENVILGGIRTRDLRIRSPARYPLRYEDHVIIPVILSAETIQPKSKDKINGTCEKTDKRKDQCRTPEKGGTGIEIYTQNRVPLSHRHAYGWHNIMHSRILQLCDHVTFYTSHMV